MNTKITIFFMKLFSNKILGNEIVATTLFVISKELEKFKTKMDNILNTDI
jgi:hypothetical protein